MIISILDPLCRQRVSTQSALATTLGRLVRGESDCPSDDVNSTQKCLLKNTCQFNIGKYYTDRRANGALHVSRRPAFEQVRAGIRFLKHVMSSNQGFCCQGLG
jgi:hypothetical protein